MLNKVELLSPVGSIEALYAAVENGADAVYLGGKLFNARQYASNFDYEELEEAIKYAHIRNVKIYVTLNIMLSDEEIKEAIDYLIFLYNIDVDAIIIQDLGLAMLVRNILPDLEIHGSTQMSINNHMGVKFLEELGFERVVLARELNLKETRYIKENTNVELETFIHGALCVCYSGQCLMSSMIGGRSGNRGTCAQTCRMKYSIVDSNTNKVFAKDFEEKHILSPKDLNTVEYLNDIVDSGVDSLKIEGRMKKPEYVAIVIDKYRKALDDVLNKRTKSIKDKDQKDMAQMFNRGFTKGYIKDDFGEDYVSIDKPNNRGIYIGDVIKIDKKYIHVKLKENLNKGDGIEFINRNSTSEGIIVDKLILADNIVDHCEKGNVVKVKFVKGVLNNAKVHKTYDIKLNQLARESFENKKNKKMFPIDMDIKINIGKPIELKVSDGNRLITVISDELVERAMKVSLKKEKVENQMSKLGDTPYILKNIKIDLEDGAMVPISVLNKVRRIAIEKLDEKRSNFNNRMEIRKEDLNDRINQVYDFPLNNIRKTRQISVKIDTLNQFKQLNLNKLDRIYLNFRENLLDCIKEVKKYNKQVYISTEKIISNMEFANLKNDFDKIITEIDGISVSNIGTLKFIKDNYKTNIHCDIGLNIFNSLNAKLLYQNKVSSLTLSPELKLNQISKICKNNFMEYESIVYGYLPLMTMKYCPMSLIKKCKSSKDCSSCNFKENYGLYDRKGMTFEFKRKEETTTIYNSQSLMVIDYLDKIYSSNVNLGRLDFTLEKDNINEIQSMYYDFANNKVDIKEVEKFVDYFKLNKGITKGHYFRGIL
ncbi:protease [Gottschalkia purinilytica]|uniref:Protease n=1 Tax=Gottschalkia purinilytica TaxID=1503 RepID=A0A0L0W7K8_GOTPU|nr:U32 family peptidase [Gottschalkia purinilytica]KNF07494.1 protease [Gottschalkia purinilytica]